MAGGGGERRSRHGSGVRRFALIAMKADPPFTLLLLRIGPRGHRTRGAAQAQFPGDDRYRVDHGDCKARQSQCSSSSTRVAFGISFEAMTRLLIGPPPRHFLRRASPAEPDRRRRCRRIGGHLRSESKRGDDPTSRRGGESARGRMRRGGQTERPGAKFVIEGFKQGSGRATGERLIKLEVSDGPGKRPIYDMVFGTRHPRGLELRGRRRPVHQGVHSGGTV